MDKINVSIIGASGYAGGELLRLLLFHPNVEIKQITSESYFGKFARKVHPNLRNVTDLKFSSMDNLETVDVLFLGLAHKVTMKRIDQFIKKADKIIDLSADFRLKAPEDYKKWYNEEHIRKDLLEKFVYGIPELHREEMKTAKYISSAGCNATTTILGLYPLFKNNLLDSNRIFVETKVGSSEGGAKHSSGSHHPERSGVVRSYAPTGHRHTAEIIQELDFGNRPEVNFSATSIDMVRGILATSHVFLKDGLQEKDIWKAYRKEYASEPFVRIVKERDGNFRFPEPKLLIGTNYCDVGFQKDTFSNRLVVISAIDNLMKGAAGQAVQAFNIMHGLRETTALEFPGLHPI